MNCSVRTSHHINLTGLVVEILAIEIHMHNEALQAMSGRDAV